MAMLHLSMGLGCPLQVVTVDHGLRAEAAAEAAAVGRVCTALGVPHVVVPWHWDGRGNLQDAARRGRRAVIADWARRNGVEVVALGHTQDDVAETFVMRLARGAGVDGLAAMSGDWVEGGIRWVRPLLTVSRAELRAYLAGLGQVWADDPSNDNDRFERVRVRKALVGLQGLGVSAARLAEVAAHLGDARAALEQAAASAFGRVAKVVGPAVRLDLQALASEAAEVQRRVLGLVLARLVVADYAPRGASVQRFLARALAGQAATLAGVRFQVTRTGAWCFREVPAAAVPAGQVWDGRWQIVGDLPEGAEVRALGSGIALCQLWRDTGLPRASLLTSPALWVGDRLLAAPHASFGPGYSVISLFDATG
ncbi:MAG: tRNA lysidine(34) synthetase TilS [Candidatus Saccharibacteria bacterium]|nr:tRNA lysidine(34) synthetase TilS [Pseudorhodobacter sp.]